MARASQRCARRTRSTRTRIAACAAMFLVTAMIGLIPLAR